MQMIRWFGGIVIALIVFVGFGGTFREMATNAEYGYLINTSSAFNMVYLTNGSKYIGNMTTISYGLQQKISTSKYNDSFLNFMMTIAREVASTVFEGFVFVKGILIIIINTLGIPPIIFSALITMIIAALAVLVARAVFGRDL